LSKNLKKFVNKMKIFGNGVDIVNNFRIKKSIKNNKFVNRIFSIDEIKDSKKVKNKTNFFAKRFAAKEAFAKSLGTGFVKGINFKDISVKNNKFGKPEIHINSKIKSVLYNKYKIKNFKIFLSLADEKNHSIAFVIINKG
tara:strand:- start:242 stop:661 length:420 start_codon:yes stop_codon:yes gene_type:complete